MPNKNRTQKAFQVCHFSMVWVPGSSVLPWHDARESCPKPWIGFTWHSQCLSVPDLRSPGFDPDEGRNVAYSKSRVSKTELRQNHKLWQPSKLADQANQTNILTQILTSPSIGPEILISSMQLKSPGFFIVGKINLGPYILLLFFGT